MLLCAECGLLSNFHSFVDSSSPYTVRRCCRPTSPGDVACMKVTTEDFRNFQTNSRVCVPWANFWWVTVIPNCTRQLSKKYCLRTATVSSSNMTIVWRSRARQIFFLVDMCQCLSKKGSCQPYPKGENRIFCARTWHKDAGND